MSVLRAGQNSAPTETASARTHLAAMNADVRWASKATRKSQKAVRM